MVVGASLFVYLIWYVAPVENIEMVKIVAVTKNGCIGETFDGFCCKHWRMSSTAWRSH